MVDLMMWLVIAALLLAAALQGIGFYQRAAYLSSMKTDLNGIGSRVMASSSMEDGTLTLASARKSADSGTWSKGVGYVVEQTTDTKKPFLRAAHQHVPNVDVVYLFEACGHYGAGINVMPKGGSPECGITASPDDLWSAKSASVEWTTQYSAGTAKWWGTASSTDGSKLIASSIDAGGKVVISRDSGKTWETQTSLGTKNWRGVASSGDGRVLVAGQNLGAFFYSTDSGATWTQPAALPAVGNWWGVAVSNDGTTIVANDFRDGFVYVSKDSGANWSKKDSLGVGKWRSVAVSADGKKIVVGQAPGSVYHSTDGGLSWEQNAIGTGYWSGIAASLDGSRIVASDYYTGYVQTSKDSGVNWRSVVSLGTGTWRSVSSSGDGMHLSASNDDDNRLYVSADAGVSWSIQEEAGIGPWYGIAVSGDGTRILGGVTTGELHTGAFGTSK